LNVTIHHQWASLFACIWIQNLKFLLIIMHHLIMLILTMKDRLYINRFNDT
jgi:hypothetical protein